MKAQVFITCMDRADIASVWPETGELAMFHVEQGTVRTFPECDVRALIIKN